MQHTLTSNKGFYIGDICYVLSDEVYHDIWGNQNSYQEGKIQVGNYAFAVDRTAYGDGTYADNNGREYSVDAGVIGCVPFELVDMEKLHESYDSGADPVDILNDLGLFIEGSQAEFETDDEGVFTVAVDNQIAIVIDTNHEADYEEDSGEYYDSDEYYDDSDEEYFEEYDEESAEEFVEYNGLEPGDEYIEKVQYGPESNVEKVLAQARDNPAMFQIHGQGEVASDGVTVKFIYYANPRKPLDGTYIDIDSSDPNFGRVFKGHLSRYLPQEEVCEVILMQLVSYLRENNRRQSAKEQISDNILSKLDEFDAYNGNYPLEGATIYYDSQYVRFHFTGVDEGTAKKEVLLFLRSQGFTIKNNQLYATKYGSSLTVYLPTSSLPEPSSKSASIDYTTVVYPDDFPIDEEYDIDAIENLIVKDNDEDVGLEHFCIWLPNLRTAKFLRSAKTVYGLARCYKLENIVIEEGVQGIGRQALQQCESLTSIKIPNSVAKIGVAAFAYCRSLTNIELPKSLTSIGDRAFADCSSLTSIKIPNSVISIKSEAFENCSSLTSVEIPNSVTSIDSDVFRNCGSLKDIHFTGAIDEWKELHLSLELGHSIQIHCTDGTINT